VEIFLISGIPGAGKTTVARALAQRFPRAVHVESDRIGEIVVSGAVFPHQEPREEASRQLELRRVCMCRMADTFADAGFVVVLDDVVVLPGVLAAYQADVRAHPLVFVQLTPRLDVVRDRDAGRDKHWFEVWSHLDAEMRNWEPKPGLWLDTSDLTVEETVDAILDRSGEAVP
jgi:predicted kinase